MADEFLEGRHRKDSLSQVASYIEHRAGLGRQVVLDHLVNRLGTLQPSQSHLEVPRWPWAAIYTTNYDQIVEQAYESTSERNLVVIRKSSDLTMHSEWDVQASSSRQFLYKLHGCISNPNSEETPLVVSDDDYFNFPLNKRAFIRLLESKKYTHTFLFIGYSFSDSYMNEILRDVQDG